MDGAMWLVARAPAQRYWPGCVIDRAKWPVPVHTSQLPPPLSPADDVVRLATPTEGDLCPRVIAVAAHVVPKVVGTPQELQQPC